MPIREITGTNYSDRDDFPRQPRCDDDGQRNFAWPYYAAPIAGAWGVVERESGRFIFVGRDQADAAALAADLNGEGQ
jgi:hypothetical protein